MNPRSMASRPLSRHRRVRLWPSVTAGVILLTALVMSITSQAAGTSAGFPDVPTGNPYYAAITDLASRGVIGGYANGNFGPNDAVTRQQFAKMIVLAEGYPVSESDVCPFTDVAVSGPSAVYPDNYVAVCASRGITTGTTATTFNPTGNITRQQLITMVARAASLSEPPAGYQPDFTAAQFSLDVHYQNARKAAYAGLLNGLVGMGPGYSFTAGATRGEVAQILHNLPAQAQPHHAEVVYVAGWQGEGIYEVSVQEAKITSTVKTSLYNNYSIALNPRRGEVYVAEDNGGAVSINSLSPLRETGVVKENLGWNVNAIAVSPDGTRVYATSADGTALFRRITAIDPQSAHSVASVVLDLTWAAAYLAVSPDGQSIYVSWDSHLDTYTPGLSLVRRDTVPGATSGQLAVSPDGRYLYLSQSGKVIKWDAQAHAVAGSVSLSGVINYSPVAVSSSGSEFWAPTGGPYLYQVDSSLATSHKVDIAGPAGFIAYSGDGKFIYATMSSKKALAVVECSSGTTVKTVEGLSDCKGIAVLPSS